MSDFIWVGDKRMSGPMVMERIAEMEAEVAQQTAYAQHWAESSKRFHDLADDWRMSFKGEEMRAEEAEAERDRLEKENREMFRQLLGAGETFNKMNAELRELQSNGKAP